MPSLAGVHKTRNFIYDHIIEILLVVIIVFFWTTADRFMSAGNMLNILSSAATQGVIALGMAMCIICGQMDFSVGSTVAMSGIIVAICCRDLPAAGWNLTVACIFGMLIALVFAIAVAFAHAMIQHKLGLPSFIITMATQNIIFGIAAIISAGFPIPSQFPDWFNKIGAGYVWVIPIPAIILLVVFAMMHFVMKYTTTGRSIYASGGNAESARLSGINVYKSKIIVFIVVQVLATLSGFINSGKLDSATYNYGQTWPLGIISMVIIGGVSMFGGKGSLYGCIIGVLFLSVLLNGMTMLNLDLFWQYVVRGGILLFAVILNMVKEKQAVAA